MSQKAAKSLATRNAALLLRVHLISVALHIIFLLKYWLFSRLSLTPYLVLGVPTIAIEFYLERIGRPRFNDDGSLRSAGEDLGASGLTEYMFDVLYWTWGCMFFVGIFGNRAWWIWTAIPVYLVYLLYTTFMGMKRGFAGGAGASAGGGDESAMPKSKNQLKKEKIAAKRNR